MRHIHSHSNMTNSPNLPEDQQDDEISLLELLTALAKHKLLIWGCLLLWR